MTISWYGEGCFKIQTKEAVILTDPFDSSSGLTPPRLKSDLLLKTLNSFPPEEKQDEGYINGAGEYDLKGINILGLPLKEESTPKFLKTVYLMEIEDMRILLLGHLSGMPEASALERADEVDILFIPAGGKPFIEEKSAAKLVKNLEPKIVIPSFFKVKGLKRQTKEVKSFLDELNCKSAESGEKLTLKKKDLADIKATKVFVLNI